MRNSGKRTKGPKKRTENNNLDFKESLTSLIKKNQDLS